VDIDEPELFVVKRRLRDLKKSRLEAVRQNGLAFYVPHPRQDMFHRAGGVTNRRMVRAGNRWGKSEAGCAEDVSWLLGERLFYPKNDPARTAGIPRHGVKLLTITTDWDKVSEIWTGPEGKVWKFLPMAYVVSKKTNHSGAIDQIHIDYKGRKSVWRFDTVKSFKANPMGQESSDWDAVHIDEPCPEQQFKGVARGLVDRQGHAWFTLTPLNEAWINDYFFPEDTGGEEISSRWSITGTIFDNPHLSQDAISEFEALLTEEEKQCRMYGLPLHLAGLIYKQFDKNRHVLKEVPEGWKSFGEPPVDWPIYIWIDVHPQTPHAVNFFTVSPHGQVMQFLDIFEHCSIAALCLRIRSVVGSRTVVAARVDPLAYINDPVTMLNMATEFHRCGVHVQKATKALAEGILKTQECLAKDNYFYITPLCRTTLWEIQRYCWDEKGDKPVDKDDHCMENLYRCMLHGIRWVDFKEHESQIVNDIEIVGPGWENDETVDVTEELQKVY